MKVYERRGINNLLDYMDLVFTPWVNRFISELKHLRHARILDWIESF